MKSNNFNFENYDLHFFGHATGGTPQNIILLDNNGEILLFCEIGKNIEQLKESNIEITQSQLKLLLDWRLLQEENKIFKTNLPILNSSKTKSLREITRAAALKMGPELEEEVGALKDILKSQGYEKSIYTILFSYILDELFWHELKEAEKIMEKEITIREPFWAGFLWALYPSRKFFCGTNSSTSQGVGLYHSWSQSGEKLVLSIYSNNEAFIYLFEDIVKYGKVKNKIAIKVFEPYNIFDTDGNLTIPIIVVDMNNSLYKLCKILSQKVAKQVENTLNLTEIGRLLGIEDKGETIIVAYHELMWDILDYFETQDIIQKPFVFANPEKAKLKDVSDLMFIVKSSRG